MPWFLYHGKRMKTLNGSKQDINRKITAYPHLGRLRVKLIFTGKFLRILTAILQIAKKLSSELVLHIRRASS
jgi:hypothetical protein